MAIIIDDWSEVKIKGHFSMDSVLRDWTGHGFTTKAPL